MKSIIYTRSTWKSHVIKQKLHQEIIGGYNNLLYQDLVSSKLTKLEVELETYFDDLSVKYGLFSNEIRYAMDLF